MRLGGSLGGSLGGGVGGSVGVRGAVVDGVPGAGRRQTARAHLTHTNTTPAFERERERKEEREKAKKLRATRKREGLMKIAGEPKTTLKGCARVCAAVAAGREAEAGR